MTSLSPSALSQAALSQAAISQSAEERFGIKVDSGDVKKLQEYLLKTYGREDEESIDKIFSSGEAAGFLTVNETYFFREPIHFSFLWSFLPSFEGTGIRICSAAVASGCEAYSIAMLIETYNKSIAKPLQYHIDAFDLNPKVIENACKGIYSERALREDGSNFRYMAAPYLTKLESGYQVNSSLKKNICFFEHNLMDALNREAYDFVFFRNAFIYFLPQYRERVLSNLSAVLKEDGILIAGVSETAGICHDDLDAKNQGDVFYFQYMKRRK